MERTYPLVSAATGGIGAPLCNGSRDIGYEQCCDDEGDKDEGRHGSGRAGRTKGLPLENLHITSTRTGGYIRTNN